MKKIYSLLFLFVCFASNSNAQISISTQSINFGSKTAFVKDSVSIIVTNPTQSIISIGSLSTSDTAFSLRAESPTVAANSTGKVWVRIYTPHNLTYNERVYISIPTTRQTFKITVTATVNYSEAIYNSTQNKWDSQLLSALTTIASSGHSALGYSSARTKMFGDIDDYDNNNNIACVYTGRIVNTSGIPSASAPDNMNTEHTWPQSQFSSNDPMVSDIHHLYPTDVTANGARSNYPFGVVSSVSNTYGQSKLGTLTTGGTGFEPWDGHKGNVARSMMYFITRYKNQNANWGNFYDNNQDVVFRKWNKLDPVDAHEKTRNNRIEQYQGNRNPFIDHPELADRIYDFISSGNRASAPKFSVSSLNLKFGGLTTGSSYDWWIHVGNTGTANLTISSVQSNNAKFAVQNVPTSISAGNVDSFKVVYTPSVNLEIPTGNITISTNAGNYTIKLNDTGNGDFNNNGSSIGQTGGGSNPTGTSGAPNNLTFSSVQTNSFTINWNYPSGYSNTVNDFLVIVKEGSNPTTASGDITNATANSNYGSASALLGSDGKLIYKGDGNNVSLTGLLTQTTYYIDIYTVLNSSTYSSALEGSKQTATAGGPGTNIAYGQNFEGWTTGGGSYTNYNLAGTTGTGDWLVTNGYKATGSTSGDGYVISGSFSVRLRNAANSAVTSPFITEGIGDIEFNYRQWDGVPALTFIVETSANGTVWTTIDSIPNFTSTSNEKYYKSVQDVNAKYFRVRNKGEERLMIDDIQISAYGAATPVEITAFTVNNITDGAFLQWTTASESNNSGFDVERSDDNTNYDKIGFVQGAGTTTSPKNYEYTDNGRTTVAWYRLKQIDLDGKFRYNTPIYYAGIDTYIENNSRPMKTALLGNYPNPFNPVTKIGYQVSAFGKIKLTVYDLLGREITTLVEDSKPAGTYFVDFISLNLPSGIYVYALKTDNRVEYKKMTLLK